MIPQGYKPQIQNCGKYRINIKSSTTINARKNGGKPINYKLFLAISTNYNVQNLYNKISNKL